MTYRANTVDALSSLLGPPQEDLGVQQLVHALKAAGAKGLNVPETVQRSALDITAFINALDVASREGIVESFADHNTQRLRLTSR